MKIVQALLDDLAGIGATIGLVEDRLLLRAGSTEIPGTLVRQIREAKRDLIRALAAGRDRGASPTHEDHRCEEKQAAQERGDRTDGDLAPERFMIDWLNEHPAPSPPGLCAWCGRPESLGAMVVPFGTEPGTHTWLHPECWSPWHRARMVSGLALIGGLAPVEQGGDQGA
jgi:hypothetical protein